MNTNRSKRLMKEISFLEKTKPDYIVKFSIKNLDTIYIILKGPQNSIFEGGEYIFQISYPLEYPFKPPTIQIITPNGRFLTETNLCISFSNFHPELWSPSYNIDTISQSLISFFLDNDLNHVGSTKEINVNACRAYAKSSKDFNLKWKHLFD